MLNKMKARLLIGLGGLAVTSFIVMMGYTIGSQSVTNHTQKQIQSEAQKLLTKEKEKEKASVLSDELVKEFLTQYYTKEKLGENNNRIKPYMTDSAFKEEVARQEDSINQVYKDYMLDYRLSLLKSMSIQKQMKRLRKYLTRLFTCLISAIRLRKAHRQKRPLLNYLMPNCQINSLSIR